MTSEKQIEAFARYRRKQIAELRPYIEGEDVSHVSISPEDAKAGSPRVGDMIARNPKNHADQWLVAHAYFLDNFEPLTAAEQAEPVWGDREDDLTDAIRANHPFRTKRFDIYERAQQLVSNRHSKAALIELVCYLLVQAEPAPAADAPLGAVENGRVFLQRLVDHYDFQCEAGGLANCSDYHEAVRCFEAMAEWIYHHAPAARSGAVKVKPLEWVRGWMNAEAQTDIGLYQIAYRRDGSFEWCFGIKKEWASSWDAAKEAAQADYERRILAALEPAEPATDAERKWPDFIYDSEAEPNTRPPESRLREALEEIAKLKTVRDRPDDYNRGFADGRWQAVKIARAALAQGADDERA